MRISIVTEDNRMFNDGLMFLVDCQNLRDKNIHAVQWYDEWGEVEYKTVWVKDEKHFHSEPNSHITDLSMVKAQTDEWNQHKKAFDLKNQLLEEERQKMLAQQEENLK